MLVKKFFKIEEFNVLESKTMTFQHKKRIQLQAPSKILDKTITTKENQKPHDDDDRHHQARGSKPSCPSEFRSKGGNCISPSSNPSSPKSSVAPRISSDKKSWKPSSGIGNIDTGLE